MVGRKVKIKKVKIKNYRALRDLEICFDDITTFIGPNGAGKSSIMYALDWFFNSYGKTSNLCNEDCHCNNGEEISVEVTFNDLTEHDKEVLGKYVTSLENELSIIKTRNSKGEERLSANSVGYKPFTEIKELTAAREIKEKFNQLIVMDTNLSGIDRAVSKPDVEVKMREFENSHRDLLEKVPSHLSTDFFGFNGQGVMRNNFNFIFISADLRATEEANDENRSSIISKIIESTINRQEAEVKINELYNSISSEQRKVYEEVYGDIVTGISRDMNLLISQYTLNKKVEISPKIPELLPPKARFDIGVLDSTDDPNKNSVNRQGHGFQRTLIISALQYLANHGRGDGNDATICLAIEEPELYQHPIQVRVFNSSLRKIVTDNPNKTQVMFATHSSLFIETKEVNKIRKIRCLNSAIGSEVKWFSLDDLYKNLSKYVKKEIINKQIKNILGNELSEAVFSDKVILLEGSTDYACIKGIVDSLLGIDYFERFGVNYVICGSKTNIVLYAQILRFLGIQTYTIFDGDKSVNQATASNMKNNANQNGNISEFLTGDRIESPTTKVCESYTVYEENLEDELKKIITDFEKQYQEHCRRNEINTPKNSEIYYEIIKSQNFKGSFFAEMVNTIAISFEIE